MILLALHKVDKFYGPQTVLEEATVELRAGQRTALIGRNGAGKTTILNLLGGRESPDAGQVYQRPETLIGKLEQDMFLNRKATVTEVAEEAFADLLEMEGELRQLEAAGLDDPSHYRRWEEVHERFERRGGYARRSRRDAVLFALGFRGREDDRVAHLSGGERTRLGLAATLMAQGDVLLLDEPTNHLDMDMRGWLEGFLKRYPGAAMIVSHDRTFLDAACHQTVEISRGALRNYDGNPTAFRLVMAEQERIDARTRANQHREHARLESATAQMKRWAGQNEKLHRRAKAMERRVERYADDMIEDATAPERTTRFRFDSDRSGEMVMVAEHLTKGFQQPLFDDVEAVIRRGERIGLVGPNGAGKSTFLKVLVGDLASDDGRGEIRFGSRVRVGYYDQTLHGVDPDLTLMEEMIRLTGEREAHNLLGRFLFPFDAQYKRVRDLSGGERARLALLKLTLGRHNFLILDEPTNHLDVEMIEALEQSLTQFEGTLLVVSHDRTFLAQVTARIWEVRDGAFRTYDGDFDYFQRKRKADGPVSRKVKRAPPPDEDPVASSETPWQLEQRLESLEAKIQGLESALGVRAETLARPHDIDQAELARMGRDHARLEAELLAALGDWEQTTKALAAARGDR